MAKTVAEDGQSPVIVESPTQLTSDSEYTGVSDSSFSPRTPATPRSPQICDRKRPRYPNDLGRVPLHRRGTSGTYERLEDLLREAGYKETRIITPETERSANGADDDDDLTIVEEKRTSMVKDVVGYLTGLIPSVGASIAGSGTTFENKLSEQRIGAQTRDNKRSLFASRQSSPHHVARYPTSSEHPQIVVHPTTPDLNQARGQHHQAYHRPPHNRHSTQIQMSQELELGLTTHTMTNLHAPRPSRATAYLRHISSAPNVILQRPNSTPAARLHSPHSGSRSTLSSSGGEELSSDGGNSEQPPLPTSWLETVAKAVLFGGAGAHVGGPLGTPQALGLNSTRQERQASPARQLRPSRSSLSQMSHKSHYNYQLVKSPLSTDRTRFSDSTNITPSRTPSGYISPGLTLAMPAALVLHRERGKAGKCVSEVSLTRVMCRSAPGSRSGSVVRSDSGKMKERNKRRNLGADWDTGTEPQERGRNRGVKRRGGGGWLKGRDKEKLRVPSLARMHVEGDVWSSNMKTRKRNRAESAAVHGFGTGIWKDNTGYGSEGEVSEHGSYSESEDEEEGELNLARMLLPSKRQHSIRSLRKHLVADSAKRKPDRHLGADRPNSVDSRMRRQTPRAASLLSPNHVHTGEGEEERIFLNKRSVGGKLDPHQHLRPSNLGHGASTLRR